MINDILKQVTMRCGYYFAKNEENILFSMKDNNWKIDVINEFFTKNIMDKNVAKKAAELSKDCGLDEHIYSVEYWQKKQIDTLCDQNCLKELVKKIAKKNTTSSSTSSSYDYGCGSSSSRSSYGCGSSSSYGC